MCAFTRLDWGPSTLGQWDDGTEMALPFQAAGVAHLSLLFLTPSSKLSPFLSSSRDLDGVDESAPYAARPMDYYAATKIAGEKLVLETI